MKIILVLAALICAASYLPKVDGFNFRIPGVGTVSVEVKLPGKLDDANDSIEDRPATDDGDVRNTSDLSKEQNDENVSSTEKNHVATVKNDERVTTSNAASEAEAATELSDGRAEKEARKDISEVTDDVASSKPATDAKGNNEATEHTNSGNVAEEETQDTEQTEDSVTKKQANGGKETSAGSSEQNTEVNQATSKNPQHKETTAKPRNKADGKNPTAAPKATTAQLEETTNGKVDGENEEAFDFDDEDDIWGDMEDPPAEFGREYDLDPKQMKNEGCLNVSSFEPKLELPEEMIKDMFFKPQPNAFHNVDHTDSVEPLGKVQAWVKSIFPRLTALMSVANIKEELDTIPGKIQSIMDRFRQKKSEALVGVRERMDTASEDAGRMFREDLHGDGACEDETKKCLENAKKYFKQYEQALQREMNQCLEKVQRIVQGHDDTMRKFQTESENLVAGLQGCASQLEKPSALAILSSVINFGSCTALKIKSKIEGSLKPQLGKLMDMVKQQSDQLGVKVNRTSDCFEQQVQLSKFQEMQRQIMKEGRECMRRKGKVM